MEEGGSAGGSDVVEALDVSRAAEVGEIVDKIVQSFNDNWAATIMF